MNENANEIKNANANENANGKCGVVLIGMPGGGKSAAGRMLARLLRLPFSDTDAAAEKTAGMSVAEIFAAHGESHFRRLESDALGEALKQNQIIAAGGGIILDPKNRKRIRDSARAVYLCAPLQLLVRRLQKDKTARPLLAKDLAASLSELSAKREMLYRQTAHLAVMQNERDTPADVAAKVRAGLRNFLQ